LHLLILVCSNYLLKIRKSGISGMEVAEEEETNVTDRPAATFSSVEFFPKKSETEGKR